MIRYGDPIVEELVFEQLEAKVEPRDDQWVDVEVTFKLGAGCTQPDGIEELTALIIVTHRGDIAQIVPQDEGRDCEFQFTEAEKEQLRSYYEEHVRSRVNSLPEEV